MNAKGAEVSLNLRRLEAKLDDYLGGTISTVTVREVENVASILGARGGAKGGTSTSEAKRTAAAVNGAKGGRPPRPNLCIKFTKSVWQEPDPKLLNELCKLVGTNTWLPDEDGKETEGPYVRVHVSEVSTRLEKLLSNSLSVWEWDHRGIYRFCREHTIDSSYELPAAEKHKSACTVCGEPADWIY